ncbi:Ribosomal L28 family [Zea mays]|uniref:Ribosomal L28 family n=2 Tax=Zea mays TaxID=4577 RepID=A0A1D6IE56_MAIZE|nr:Ribosomal L28 family [Zea mays]
MSFRAREMYKKVVRRVGGEGKLPAELMKSVKDMLPDSNVIMGRAKRGIFAGRHIRFGNKVSEDGGNKTDRSLSFLPFIRVFFSGAHSLEEHVRRFNRGACCG